MEAVKRVRNFGENYTSIAKVGKQEMSTPLEKLGLERPNREALLKIFNTLAKSDFWHDFGSSLMQDLLNNTSLTSSLSFAERGKTILAIRESIGTKLTVQDYFMDKIDEILPGGVKDRNTYRTEKKLLREIGIDFDSIEAALKSWNETDKKLSELPKLDNITPKYGPYSRNYSVNAVPVKAYRDNIYLPSVFTAQTKVKNFILMIDASHLSLTELGVRKTLPTSASAAELLDVVGDFDEDAIYNFYIVQSNENDSDPATKITKVDVDKELKDKINIYFLKDEGNISIYPPFLGSDLDEGQNENLYSKIAIQSTRVDTNKITATLSGSVNTIVEDLGEISKIEKAAQKAVDTLVENRGVVNAECLSYFLLKRAGDWCQALCLLDTTREYTLYKQEEYDVTVKKKIKKVIGPVSQKKKVSIQDLVDEYKAKGEQIVVGLVTFDRVLLAFALLLGLNIFFTTKYLNVNTKQRESARSIHWSIFFENTLSSVLSESDKGKIVETGKILEKSNFDDIQVTLDKIKSDIPAIEAIFQELYGEIQSAASLNVYLTKIHLLTYLQTIFITPEEVSTFETKVLEIRDKLVERNKSAPASEAEFKMMRDELLNFKTLNDKLKVIANQNASLLTTTTYPDEEHYQTILKGIADRLTTKTSTDFRKHISYNNFLEDIVKTLEEKFSVILSKKMLNVEQLSFLEPPDPFTLKYIVPTATTEASRSQSLILRYIRDALVKAFPKGMSGGYKYKIGSDIEYFKNLIEKCFFGIRNRGILALNLYNYNKLMYDYGRSAAVKDMLIGLKQDYVTDKNGNYFSILDNYLVTDAEEKYFIDTDEDDRADLEISKFVGTLETDIKKGDKMSKLYLLMFRYVIMRQRLYICDKYFKRYRELLGKYEEEIRTLLELNPEGIRAIQANDSEYLSDALKIDIRKLLQDSLELRNEIKKEGLLYFKTDVPSPTTYKEFFNNIFYLIADIRLIIFSYSRRYYTPATELEFREFEAAKILSELKIPEAEKDEIVKTFQEEFAMEKKLEEGLEKTLNETSTKDAATEAKIRVQEKRTIIDKKAELSGSELADYETIAANTIAKLVDEDNSIVTKLDILATVASAKSAGGRRRKTRKSKKRSSKRRSRKH